MCAVTLLGYDGNPFDQRSILPGGGRFIETLVRVKLTGNYTTGGDTLDWTNAGGTPAAPNVIPPLALTHGQVGPDIVILNDGPVPTGTVLSNGGSYVVIPGLATTNWLLKIFATAGAQYANGAYGADALTDIPVFRCMWAR